MLIEPATLDDDDSPPRSVIYTNNKLIPPSHITPLALPFKDVSAVSLVTDNAKTSLFINV